ncbi:hypothetical protein CARUB_v10018228mg [Capsella rubella]|uniref:Uncharacterized protein n=1 Tax=Capsella rubella TaxID=81985 RepID=R0FQU0_9BRAS|nr:hypothetical protein CARUB_v10018228mg [Capsella rubella]
MDLSYNACLCPKHDVKHLLFPCLVSIHITFMTEELLDSNKRQYIKQSNSTFNFVFIPTLASLSLSGNTNRREKKRPADGERDRGVRTNLSSECGFRDLIPLSKSPSLLLSFISMLWNKMIYQWPYYTMEKIL